jgi:outer membrane protein OmpA-like peptidoglycan-associated protein
MSKLSVAFVWFLVLVTGFGGFGGLYYTRKTDHHQEQIDAYEKKWKDALNDPVKLVPPVLEDEVKKAAGWRRAALRREFEKLEGTKKYKTIYARALDSKITGRTSKFRSDWEKAVDDFADEPSVDKAVAEFHETHQDKVRKRLVQIEKDMRKKHPRTKLALDSFLGYCIFRAPAFKKRLIEQGIELHLVDDRADYKKRLETLNKGETPLALFTIDALINTSAALDSPPAAIVMVVDESRGADAIVADKRALPNLGALNRKDVKIVLTPDSPSETLARVVRSRYLPSVSADAAEAVEDDKPEEVAPNPPKGSQEKILDRFKATLQESSPKPTAFVLWQPYVSMALGASPNAHVLVDSSHCPSYIVDVLVVQKAYLNDPKHGKERREVVKKIVRAYLETLNRHEKDMAAALREDWQQFVDENKFPKTLDEPQSREVARGIRWKNTSENYMHFGAERDANVEPVEQMIVRIKDFLRKAGVVGKDIDAKALYDAEIMKEVREGWSAPKDTPAYTPQISTAVKREDCEEVAGVPLRPIGFQTGSDEIILELALVDLQELATLMKESPRYYLEIRGHALGNTEQDRELAGKRAKAVSTWLQKEGGVTAERIFTASADSAGGKSSVSFLMLQKKDKSSR